jgi:alpha-glucosidase
MHDRLRGIRRVADEYDDRMLVGEVALQDLHRVVSFLNSGDQLHLAHNFVFAELDWDAEAFEVSIDDFEALASDRAWPAWFLENHDRPRVASRFDDPPGLGPARARASLVMLYALRGTPFVYQGEELGLPDADIPPDRVVDVDGRDPERAPMPWRPPSAAGPGAGFTNGEPWLPLVAGAEALNAETQAADEGSTLSLARRLAALRRDTRALQTGAQRTIEAGADVLAWVREDEADRLLCAVNFAVGGVALALPGDVAAGSGALVLSTEPGRRAGDVRLDALELGAGEAVILAL